MSEIKKPKRHAPTGGKGRGGERTLWNPELEAEYGMSAVFPIRTVPNFRQINAPTRDK